MIRLFDIGIYPPVRSIFEQSPLVIACGANSALPLGCTMGTVSAEIDFFLGGGWSLGVTDVGILGTDLSRGMVVVITLGVSSATELRVVCPLVGGEEREPGEDSPPCEVLALVVVRGDTRPTCSVC